MVSLPLQSLLIDPGHLIQNSIFLYVLFFEDEEVRQVYDVRFLIQDADQFLIAAWRESSAPIFRDVSRYGRLQQLESVAIRYMLCSGSYLAAATLGIRMFVEDAYLLDDAFKVAATALSEFVKDESSECWTASTKTTLKSDLRKMLRKRKRIDVDVGKCTVFAFELNQRWDRHPMLDAINTHSLSLYDECCFTDDLVGLVVYTTKEDLNLQLALKSENEGIQRTSLDIATSSTSSRSHPTSLFAIQMIVDDQISKEIDSFIVLVTDGYSYDIRSMSSLKLQIQRLNDDRETQIHIFIIGVELEDEKIIEEYKIVCSVSKLSEYINVSTVNDVGATFCAIRNTIRGPLIGDTSNKGITMERF